VRKLIFAFAVVAAFEAGRLAPAAPSGAGVGAPASYAQGAEPCAEIVARDPGSEAAQQCQILVRLQQNPGGFVDRVSTRVAQEGLSRIQARVLERAQELNARYTAVLNLIEQRLRETNDEVEGLLDESDNVLDESEDVLDDSEDVLDDTEEALNKGEDAEEELRDRIKEAQERLGLPSGFDDDNDNDGDDADDDDNA
jgi:hypothetical protein